jgi:hypothetical protein
VSGALATPDPAATVSPPGLVLIWGYGPPESHQMPAVAINPLDLAPLEEEIAHAAAVLSEEDELPGWISDLVRGIADELQRVDLKEWERDVDPSLLAELQQAGLAAILAIDEQMTGEVELALERMRDVLQDIREARLVSDLRSSQEIARWLKQVTDTPVRELAAVLGLSSERKLERWLAGETEPSGDDAMRLRVAARIVNQLRHAMTARGVLRWLQRPVTALDGEAPAALLTDPSAVPTLLALAGQARQSDAT